MRILLPLIALPLIAGPQISLQERGFNILDQVCVEVEGEHAILKSEIARRAKQKNLDFISAQDQLINERLLWVMAKKQMKYNVAEINSSAQSHAEKVMKDNNLDQERFSSILMRAPYEMSFKEYVRATASELLEHHVKSAMAAQISVSDAEINDHAARMGNQLKQSFDVVFISVLADKNALDKQLSYQFERAKQISEQITATKSLDPLIREYKKENNISVIGPLPYQKGDLKKIYDDQLMKDNSLRVTKPFKDGGAVTVICKVPKPAQKLDANALENMRKELYEIKVTKDFTAALSLVKGISTVTIKGCGK